MNETAGTPIGRYPFGDDYEVTNGVVPKYISAPGLGLVAKRVSGVTFVPDDYAADYVTFEVNAALLAFPVVGGSFEVSQDRYGRWYVGIGPQVGKGLTVVSGSLVGGKIRRDNAGADLTSDGLETFLSGWSQSAAAGFFFQLSATEGSGYEGREAGVGSPQAGWSGHFSWHATTTKSTAWDACR